MQKSSKKYVVWIVAQKNDAASINAKAKEVYDPVGGDKTLSAGLSQSGDEPAQAYWCSFVIPERKLLPWVTWLLDNHSKTYVYIAARERLGGKIQKLRDQYDIAEYRDKQWQTRAKGFAGLVSEDVTPDELLARVAADSNPSISLKPLNPQ